MKPVVDKLEIDNQDRLIIRRINREDPNQAAIVDQYQIRTQPVYILLDANDNIANQWFGSVPQETFEAAIDALLNQ